MINVWSADSAEKVYRQVMSSINDESFQDSHMERMISRNGLAVRMDSLSVMEFTDPAQCVIFDRIRNCNPALHLAESLWMLAGRNDLEFITQFTPSMKSYSDDGVTLHSAYGHRWRNHFQIDQLRDVVDNLKKDPTSRRELIVMWDPRSDLEKKNNGGKDLSCNFAMKFAQRNGRLNLTVYNRSNDSVFGCPGGANSVHFAFVQMFVAASVGMPVGSYTQVSDDLHIYGGEVYRGLAKSLTHVDGDRIFVNLDEDRDLYSEAVAPYIRNNVFGRRVDYSETIAEIEKLVATNAESYPENPFLLYVAKPIIQAYTVLFKQQNDPEAALEFIRMRHTASPGSYKPIDWFVACEEWYERIIANRKKA